MISLLGSGELVCLYIWSYAFRDYVYVVVVVLVLSVNKVG